MRRLFGWAVLAAATVVFGAAPASGQSKPAGDDELVFTVTGLKDASGQVRCALYNKSNWLDEPVVEVSAKIVGKKATCRFENVKPGTYGLAAYHDEDADDELDTNLVGIPSEGLCASRNAKGSFGPPDFDDAKFKYKGGKKSLTAKMTY
jgi:uncharacterized protein (DUF2141 family)